MSVRAAPDGSGREVARCAAVGLDDLHLDTVVE